jgi:hypothetical protein
MSDSTYKGNWTNYKNKLIFHENDDTFCFVLDQHADLGFL